MAAYPVSDTQVAVYLSFTFLSILVSIMVYCLYQHGFNLAGTDIRSYTSFYISITREHQRIISDDTTNKTNNDRLLE